MHELSLAQSILDIVEQEYETVTGATRVSLIRLDVGEFNRPVVPDSLSFCFEVITKKTFPSKGSRLELNPVPLTGRCKGCGIGFQDRGLYFFICPRCESKDIETIAGKELLIKEIEAE